LKTIALLGSTGSIGTQTLQIARKYKDKIKIVLLSASKLSDRLIHQIEEFKPEYVYVQHFDNEINLNCKVLTGEEGIIQLSEINADLFINGIAGIAGIKPTYYLLKNNKKLATANKESIICLGEILKDKYRDIFPIDSEHSAIFQCLLGNKKEYVKKIILTASGGPFLFTPIEEFSSITVKEALNHPKWSMGKKISIDSATLMNKGLEIIEAHYLFDLPYSKIDVVIHPDSIIHGMVEFKDGSILSNMSYPDMRIPISFAVSYPERWELETEPLDFMKIGKLEFFPPDYVRFPLLKIAKEYGEKGSYYPTVLTVADEIVVNKFLEGEINFNEIPEFIVKILENVKFNSPENLQDILNIIEEVKEIFQKISN
jgi:1-deoxy-D-xylulose-5-phosphate reductoisomerase